MLKEFLSRRNGLEPEPLIQTDRGVPYACTETHPGHDFEKSAAEGDSEARPRQSCFTAIVSSGMTSST